MDSTDLIGETGKIGQEDIEFGTGQDTDTFTVPTSDGETQTLTKVPDPNPGTASIIKGIWCASSAAAINDHGTTSGADYAAGNVAWTLDQMANAIGPLLLPPGLYVFLTDITIPATATLLIPQGAVLSPDTGVTVTIEGSLLAGAYLITGGAGTVDISSVPGLRYLEWDNSGTGIDPGCLPSVNLITEADVKRLIFLG